MFADESIERFSPAQEGRWNQTPGSDARSRITGDSIAVLTKPHDLWILRDECRNDRRISIRTLPRRPARASAATRWTVRAKERRLSWPRTAPLNRDWLTISIVPE